MYTHRFSRAILPLSVLGLCFMVSAPHAHAFDPHVSISIGTTTVSSTATSTLLSEDSSGGATDPAAVSAALTGVTPFTLALKNDPSNTNNYSQAALIPVNGSAHLQLWVSDDNGATWSDLNVAGYHYPQGTTLNAGDTITLQVYPVADQVGDFSVTYTVLDMGNVGAYLTDSGATHISSTNAVVTPPAPVLVGCQAVSGLNDVYVDASAASTTADGTQAHPCASIADAMTAATSSATIHLAAGTYSEQVTLTKPLSFVGAGASTIIEEPTPTYTLSFQGATYLPIILSNGYALSLSQLSVDGQSQGSASNLATGIAVQNAAATIDHVAVKNAQVGMLLADVSSPSVSNTTISSTDATATTTVGLLFGYDLLPGVIRGSITGNTFSGTGYGLVMHDYLGAGSAPSNLSITRNSFTGTLVAGFWGNDNITIARNYWNAAAGPTYGSSAGDTIVMQGSASVFYNPWYTDAGLTTLNTDVVTTTTTTSSGGSSSGGGGGGSSSGGSGGSSSGGSGSASSAAVVAGSAARGYNASAGRLATSTPASGQVLGATTYHFTRDLTLKSKGDDVSALQSYLIASGFAIKDAPTGYFGVLTRSALAAFQKAHSITPAAGYFGAKTRALVNKGLIETVSVSGSH